MFYGYFIRSISLAMWVFSNFQKGMRGEYALGKFLKRQYVEHYNLLNATYLHREVCQLVYNVYL